MDASRIDSRNDCAMPTQHLGHCKRPGRYAYMREDRRGAVIIYTACAQHARGAGAARMLLPRAWEYTYVLDLVSGMTSEHVR